MLKNTKNSFNINNASDLAFALVVLTSYFITFTEINNVTSVDIIALISLGVTYITIGIYGFSYSREKSSKQAIVTYFLLQLCLGSMIIYLSKNSGLIALILLPLIGQSVTIKNKTFVFTINLFITLSFMASLAFGMHSINVLWNQVPTFVIGQILIITFVQMVMNEQLARKKLESTANDLSLANKRLREYALQIEELTISKERNRLAREIHDGLGHYLTTIFMQIEATSLLINKNPGEATESLEKAGKLTKEALDDVRRSVETLRGDNEEFYSLPEKINHLFDNLNSDKIESEFKVIGKARKISTQGELTIYRSVQEMLNNTIKHANASHILAYLDYATDDKNVILDYKDDGIGSNNPTGGFGIISMRERVKLLNGKIDINTNPGEGFRIKIEIPE